MFAGAQSFGDRSFHCCFDRAYPVVGGDVESDVVIRVCEAEADGDRLRQRFTAYLGDRFGLLDDIGVEKEHRHARRIWAVPPRPDCRGRSVCSNGCLADH